MDREKLLDPGKMIVQLTVGELDEIVKAVVTRALDNQPPAKLQYPLEQAAAMLNMKPYMLAQRCREKTVPYHRIGHLYFFTQEDLQEILAKSACGVRE